MRADVTPHGKGAWRIAPPRPSLLRSVPSDLLLDPGVLRTGPSYRIPFSASRFTIPSAMLVRRWSVRPSSSSVCCSRSAARL